VKKLIQIVVVSFLLVGCAGPLKQNWQNFRAYYNTYYNALNNFEEGLKKNTGQDPEINPERPIRAHLSPTNAGLEEFSNTIDKGASILRNHSESDYVSRALLLIGKSYYYRSEYFSALEKFQELYTIGSNYEKQQSILWQGRTFLEMESFQNGIQFLEAEINAIDEWDPNLLAEVYLMIAQHYTELENWSAALNYLSFSIDDLKNQDLKGRALFLYGQLMEFEGDYNRASVAYNRISNLNTDYNLEYNALRKEAEVSRELGNFEKAISVYSLLERDDKYIDQREDLAYEIARTYQLQGNREEALKRFNQILRNRFRPADNITRAKVYFGLAEVYRDDFDNFSMAAAYFDSASRENIDPNLLPADFNASELSESFGEYANVKSEITRMDSLLSLGMLEPAEFDSVILEIQQKRLEELREEEERLQNRSNQMIVADETQDSSLIAAETTEDGFLNIRNQARLLDAELSFRAIWENRPLVDNWRRRSAIRGGGPTDVLSRIEIPGENNSSESENNTITSAGINISDIPRTPEEQEKSRIKINELQYRLGNVFFLSLNMADSAKVYYNKVVENDLDSRLSAQSLYSLTEILLLEGNRDEALKFAQQLADNYPSSLYTRRVANRFQLSLETTDSYNENEVKFQYANIIQADTVEDPATLAAEFRKLAYKTTEPDEKALLLFESAKEYMAAAKDSMDNPAEITRWLNQKEGAGTGQSENMTIRDSINVPSADLIITDNNQGPDIEPADTLGSEEAVFPFVGEYWDSTRSVLTEIEEEHSFSPVISKVQRLNSLLNKPESDEINNQTATEKLSEDEIIEDESGSEIMPCFEHPQNPEVSGGLDQFLNQVDYPDWAEEMDMSAELDYLLEIAPDGEVLSYKQISSMDRSGIPQAFEQAIDQNLIFEPLNSDELVRCVFTFAVNP
jgi:tetratricopeptide (TPR) repeat protein